VTLNPEPAVVHSPLALHPPVAEYASCAGLGNGTLSFDVVHAQQPELSSSM
jgi:hypothetical protein